MQVAEILCDCRTCTRPGCSPEAGCQGHAVRELAPGFIQDRAEALVAAAAKHGLVLTIEQQPLQPLAMGNYKTVVSVRRARGAS